MLSIGVLGARCERPGRLPQLGVTDACIADELAEMNVVVYAKTANRQVTGALVAAARMLPFLLKDCSALLEASLWLAGTSCGPLYPSAGSPARATAAVFAAPRS